MSTTLGFRGGLVYYEMRAKRPAAVCIDENDDLTLTHVRLHAPFNLWYRAQRRRSQSQNTGALPADQLFA